jgi:thiamine biosynthesis lipoprotein
MQKIAFRAMGCQMLAAVDKDGQGTAGQLEQVPLWFESWEQRLSRFRPDSELNWINAHAGEDVQISTLMMEVLRSALRAARESGGLVTPTVLGALEFAGYSHSFDEFQVDQEHQVNEEPHMYMEIGDGKELGVGAGTDVVSMDQAVYLNSHARMVRLAKGVRLDLGGIGKGWAADRAARRLRRLGPALVDAGGDIAINGPMADGEPWPVGVTDPFDEEKQIDLLLIFRGGVATSGRDYRRWLKDRIWQHHIIDPRSGQPAQTDVLTATVTAPSAQMAEMAAKTALILGSWQGISWLDQRPELAGLLVLEDGGLVHSRRWLGA